MTRLRSLALGANTCDRRPQDIAAKLFAALAIVGVDADAGVERESVEEGTAPSLLERLGGTQSPFHLRGLQGGERRSSSISTKEPAGPPGGDRAVLARAGAGHYLELDTLDNQIPDGRRDGK